MLPRLDNSNSQAHDRIRIIAKREPDVLIAQATRLIELAKIQIYAMPEKDIECLINDFRGVSFPALATVPLEELPDKMAMHVSDERLAAEVADFEPFEAYILLGALELYLADERANPNRPSGHKGYALFFSILGIDQE